MNTFCCAWINVRVKKKSLSRLHTVGTDTSTRGFSSGNLSYGICRWRLFHASFPAQSSEVFYPASLDQWQIAVLFSSVLLLIYWKAINICKFPTESNIAFFIYLKFDEPLLTLEFSFCPPLNKSWKCALTEWKFPTVLSPKEIQTLWSLLYTVLHLKEWKAQR